jgi:hypothetical protein
MGDERHTPERHRARGEPAPRAIAGRRAHGGTLRRYALLLSAIVLVFAIQGIATPGRWEQLITTLLLASTLMLALRVADTKPRLSRPAAAIMLATVVVSAIAAIGGHVDDRSAKVANGLLVALAPPAILVGVVRTLRARQEVTVEAVLGVLCVYILLGMFFAFVYGSLNELSGTPFFAHGQGNTATFLYFSFTTLSTVGYGDLTAHSNLGHTLSVSEALLGQVYLVTVVSLIVANLGRSRQTPG